MSNQKFYTDTGDNKVWMPQMGAIWHVRDNEVLHDYGDTRVSEADYGAGLAEALGATGPTTLQAGDKVIVGPGTFRTAAEISCLVPNVHLIFNGTRLGPSMTSFNALLRIETTANDFVIEGLDTFDDNVSTSLQGAGLLISNVTNVTVRRCRGFNHKGGTDQNGYAFWLNGGADVTVEQCYAEGCQYTGLRGVNCNRLTIANSRMYNNGTAAATNRNMQFEGSTSIEYIRIHNVESIANASGTGALLNFACQAREITITDTEIINQDQVAPGVSYDTTSREQNIKFGETQNIENILLDNVTCRHGSNQGSGGFVVGFAIFNPPSKVTVKNSRFSDGVAFPDDRIEQVTVEDCEFGIDRAELGYAQHVRWCNAKHFSFKRNRCNMHGATRVCDLSTQAANPDDVLEVVGNRFFGTRSGVDAHMNLFDDAATPNLLASPRKVYCYDNELINNDVSNDFRHSNWEGAFGSQDLNLLLQTDPSGYLLFDDKKIGVGPSQGMPDPGSSAPYFTGVPGRTGQRIININWSPEGDSPRLERSWAYDGTGWQHETSPPPAAAEIFLSISGATQVISTTSQAVDVMDTVDIADRIQADAPTATLTINEPGRYALFFNMNIESSAGKQAMFVEFVQDATTLDVLYRGYTRDSGESITLGTYAIADITKAYLDANGGSTSIKMQIFSSAGTPTITYYNCSFGGHRLH